MRKSSFMQIEKILAELVILLPVLLLLIFVSCKGKPKEAEQRKSPESQVKHPDWSRISNIYEVNIRQFTPEGNFKAFEEHIPRLKKMGVDILWLMPVNPIGEKNRKGTLGSYYSVKDYIAVNPEFGTLDDFRNLVSKAHKEGMYVIIDWVANHSAWDNPWVGKHPEWYTKDSTGKLVSPFNWSDVADLNYDNKELWAAMRDAMIFWVKEADIDGFRCDVAGMVPIEFWDYMRGELERVKPVFMLAEAEEPVHHTKAFDMSYSWELHHIMNKIAKGEKNALDIETYFMKQDTLYPKDAYRMLFTSNHDENSWNGTEYERMGAGALCFAVLTATLPGMPLIYSGQEEPLLKRLSFFDKDTIPWDKYTLAPFYTKLLDLKHRVQPLWNGTYGGRLERIPTTKDSTLFAFIREREGERLFVITNLSDKVQEGKLRGKNYEGNYKEIFSEEEKIFAKNAEIRMKPWEYKVYVVNH